MNIVTIQTQQQIENIQRLCPVQCSIAYCLNQLRSAKIQFLNLGNLIICPQQNRLIISKYNMLIRIDSFTDVQHKI